jgi:hypothetical protein
VGPYAEEHVDDDRSHTRSASKGGKDLESQSMTSIDLSSNEKSPLSGSVSPWCRRVHREREESVRRYNESRTDKRPALRNQKMLVGSLLALMLLVGLMIFLMAGQT